MSALPDTGVGDSADSGLHSVEVRRLLDGHIERACDQVIDESPIALVYNGVAHSVMMTTARDLEDFALGYSLSEGIVASIDEWRCIEIVHRDRGHVVEMLIAQERFDNLQRDARQRLGNSACGLCGVESLEAALRMPLRQLDRDPRYSRAAIAAALQSLAQAQPLNQISGGVHAAGFASAQGLLVREDVGRHSALDKLIGARARAGNPDGFVVISSRASWELVHKAASAGIGLLAAVSAPTHAAIKLAEQCGLSLIAFARDQRMNLYTHPQRVTD
jgi:formate dehydrogenase accessory protein FdhD